jgi:hypothetical protein
MSSKNIQTQYSKLFDKLEKLKNDNESAHILQDKIYRKFIKDIVNDKISPKDIKPLALNINKYVVKKDVRRWYA